MIGNGSAIFSTGGIPLGTDDAKAFVLSIVVVEDIVSPSFVGADKLWVVEDNVLLLLLLLFVAQRGDGGTDCPKEGGLFVLILFGVITVFCCDGLTEEEEGAELTEGSTGNGDG